MSPRLSSGTVVGLLIAAALFYVGHGLHDDADPVPSFVSSAQAQEAAPPNEIDFQWVGIEVRRNVAHTLRAKIPGGWLVRYRDSDVTSNGPGLGVGLTFVPDPEYKWDGKTLP